MNLSYGRVTPLSNSNRYARLINVSKYACKTRLDSRILDTRARSFPEVRVRNPSEIDDFNQENVSPHHSS